jgi:hypothetical protein
MTPEIAFHKVSTRMKLKEEMKKRKRPDDETKKRRQT